MSRYGQAALRDEVSKLTNGTPSRTKFRDAALKLFGLAKGGELQLDKVRSKLFAVGCEIGFKPSEVNRLLDWAEPKSEARQPAKEASLPFFREPDERQAFILEWIDKTLIDISLKPTDRLVCEFIGDLMLHTTKLEVSASFRLIGQHTGLSAKTISNVAARIHDGPLLVRKPENRFSGDPTCWKINSLYDPIPVDLETGEKFVSNLHRTEFHSTANDSCVRMRQTRETNPEPQETPGQSVLDPVLDLWFGHHNSRLVYMAVYLAERQSDTKGVKVSDLKLPMARRTMYRHLDYLVAYDLLEKVSRGVYKTLPVDPYHLEAKTKLGKMKDQYGTDREVWERVQMGKGISVAKSPEEE